MDCADASVGIETPFVAAVTVAVEGCCVVAAFDISVVLLPDVLNVRSIASFVVAFK